jgi:hypothetical protein
MKYCKPYNQVFITVTGDAGFISLLVKIIDIGENEFHKSGLSAYSEYDHIPYINEKTLDLYLNNKSSLNFRPFGK